MTDVVAFAVSPINDYHYLSPYGRYVMYNTFANNLIRND